VSRRWVFVFLGAGLLAACSGSNTVPFGEPEAAPAGRDADPSTDAMMIADDDAGRGVPADGSVDAPLDGPSDATVADADEGGGASEGGDAAADAGQRDAGLRDAGSDAAPLDAAPDAPACPASSAVGNSYVDGTLGVDDAAHGGASGACAYKTITYATAHAVRNILVAAGTYSVAAGETLPLALTGRQGIVCTNATLVGQGRYQGTHATVVFNGTANTLSNCEIVGDDAPGACILVESDGAKTGHDIESVDTSNCGDAGVRIDGTLVTINNSNFHDSDQGITVSNDTQAVMSNDAFWNNGGGYDIACDPGDPDEQVTGSNDTDGGGDATCSGCQNCPFQ
jgi:hypothetical protein